MTLRVFVLSVWFSLVVQFSSAQVVTNGGGLQSESFDRANAKLQTIREAIQSEEDPAARESAKQDVVQAIMTRMKQEDKERLSEIKRLEGRIAKLKTSMEKREDPRHRSRIAKERYDAFMAGDRAFERMSVAPSENQILDELEKDARFGEIVSQIDSLKDEVERLSSSLRPESRELQQHQQEIARLEKKRQRRVDELRPWIVERIRSQVPSDWSQAFDGSRGDYGSLALQAADVSKERNSFRVLGSHVEKIHKRQDGGYDAMVRFNFVVVTKQTRSREVPQTVLVPQTRVRMVDGREQRYTFRVPETRSRTESYVVSVPVGQTELNVVKVPKGEDVMEYLKRYQEKWKPSGFEEADEVKGSGDQRVPRDGLFSEADSGDDASADGASRVLEQDEAGLDDEFDVSGDEGGLFD